MFQMKRRASHSNQIRVKRKNKEGQQTNKELEDLGLETFSVIEAKSYHDGEFFRQKVYRACQGSTLKARAQLGLEKIGLLLPLV